MAHLSREEKAFQAALPGLLAKDCGRYALVGGNRVMGIYDTYRDALDAGYQKRRM